MVAQFSTGILAHFSISIYISKDKKESEDLPLHLVPEIYYKHIPLPRYRYAVEAENKSLIEDDLKTSTLLPLDCHYLYYSSEGDFLKWIGIQDKNSVFGPYIVKNTKNRKKCRNPTNYFLRKVV